MIKKNTRSILFFAIAIGFAAVTLFVLPHDREVKNLGILLFKLLPFFFATFGIATLDYESLKKFRLDFLVIMAAFLVFFCFLVPKIIFHKDDFAELYYILLIATPYIILCLTLTYRLGGGSTQSTIRISIAMLLLMLSGLEDLAYFTVNYKPEFEQLPEVWDWVSHVTVFIGHPPTRNEIIWFAVVHVILAGAVLFVPIDKFLGRVSKASTK